MGRASPQICQPLTVQVHNLHRQVIDLSRTSLTNGRVRRRTPRSQKNRHTNYRNGKSDSWHEFEVEHTEKGIELDFPGLKVIKPVNNSFAAAVDYRNCRLPKTSSCYDTVMAHELHRVAKTIAVQMRDSRFSKNAQISLIAFLQ